MSGVTVSVVVPTRNRPLHAIECIQSILATDGLFELIVVDQSDGLETQEALQSIDDARLRYVRTPTRGVCAARNAGVDLSRGDVIAFTDDDCRVGAGWIGSIGTIFEADPLAAVVCGRVRVPQELRSRGFTESFDPVQREWQGRYPGFGADWGITANMSVRRAVFSKVGQFDVLLGAGAPLRSGGEPDFLYRVLRNGLKIINASEVEVDHLGVRAFGAESSRLMQGYGFGTGAALFKHVRLFDLDAVTVYARFLFANLQRIGACLVRGQRPRGTGYLAFFLWGSCKSFKYRVDRSARLYVPRIRA